ncbi:MAG: 7-cyano-7-deazaguanine synthase QueC [Gammaproteobacteria bacterium]|nr:7-cyano-7-deazaguanine synthase QueC [Gammaproteobacteria bacterium]
MKKAIILLSGGLDSTTCLAVAKSEGYECYAMSFNYEQKHNSELIAAKKIAAYFNVAKHEVVTLSIGHLGGSALTDDLISIPDYSGEKEIPTTYVPARNTIFLSIALGWAEILNAEKIFIGVSAVDYSGYPDCRPEYIAAFQNLANLATVAGVHGEKIKIETPLIHLSKSETIKLGNTLGVDYSLTVSCYRADENGKACGKCDSCSYRKKGFLEAGISDNTKYLNTDS